MDEIATALKELGFTGPRGRQVVLTGGGAELQGMADYAQGALGRAGADRPAAGAAGLPEAHVRPGLRDAGRARALSPRPIRSTSRDRLRPIRRRADRHGRRVVCSAADHEHFRSDY